MSNSLDILAKHRDALLLAEVGAWLHMFGKLHEEFLKGTHDLDCEIPADVPDELSAILGRSNWTGNMWNKLPIGGLNARNLSIRSLIENHRPIQRNKSSQEISTGFVKLMMDAHGRGSGIEKGILDKFAPGQETDVYLSTSLGYEPDKPINLDGLHEKRKKLYKSLLELLIFLEKDYMRLSSDEWVTFRSTLTQKINTSFSITVAETRRPLNDVTLLDQTAMSVAFFKAALAQNLLLGKWKDPSQKKVADKYRWRLLRVGLNGLTFWGNSMRISDLLSRKELINDALDKVQNILEVTYPLGTEVYRDENGSIFIVPDIANLLSYTDGIQSLEGQLQAIADEESPQKLSGEAHFHFPLPPLSEDTRDMLSFGKLAMRNPAEPAPQIAWLQEQWQQGKERDICPICGLRPQGPGKKALSRRVCDICEERRSGRSRQWIENPTTTIWIDEVADRNGQLALLVGYFDIVDWLSGSAFNTVLSLDPLSQEISCKKPPQKIKFDLQTLNDDIRERLKPGQGFKKDSLLDKLVLSRHRGGSEIVRDFYDLHVTNTDLGKFSSVPEPETPYPISTAAKSITCSY